ncbi:MAG: hypothetical protein AAF546_00155 [Verrucomicrobiota bacterium]
MPNRIIREGLLDSEAINSLSDKAECWYHRLMLICDDAGRYDGRPQMVASRSYPLRDNLRAKDVVATLDKLVEAGLIMRYEANGKPYIQLVKWQKCGKAKTSKFPWIDGSFSIEYEERETRDGVKEFIKTSLPHTHPVETLYPPRSDGVPLKKVESHTETETETETVFGDGIRVRESRMGGTPSTQKNQSKAKAGSLDEIVEFCLSLDLPKNDAEFLWHKWEGCGWRNDGKAIKDWRATVRSWKAAGYMPSQKSKNDHNSGFKGYGSASEF